MLPHLVLFASLFFVPLTKTNAQIFDVYAEPPGMDTIHLPPGYQFDNTFRFGAIVSGADSLTFEWMKAIGLDYTYTYGGPSSEEFAEMRDSSGWSGNEFERWPQQAEVGISGRYGSGLSKLKIISFTAYQGVCEPHESMCREPSSETPQAIESFANMVASHLAQGVKCRIVQALHPPQDLLAATQEQDGGYGQPSRRLLQEKENAVPIGKKIYDYEAYRKVCDRSCRTIVQWTY